MAKFDSQPLKVRNWPDFLACRWLATYCWKAPNEGYNFALHLIAIKGLHAKLWAPKIIKVQIEGISGLPLGSSGTKNHLNVAPMEERCRVYYKGEGGGLLQVWAVVSFVNLSCSWFILAPKMLQLCTNHLMLVLCSSMWVVKACQFFLVPSRSSNTPLYPSKVLQTKEGASTPYSSIVFSLHSHLSLSRSWECVNTCLMPYNMCKP